MKIIRASRIKINANTGEITSEVIKEGSLYRCIKFQNENALDKRATTVLIKQRVTIRVIFLPLGILCCNQGNTPLPVRHFPRIADTFGIVDSSASVEIGLKADLE